MNETREKGRLLIYKKRGGESRFLRQVGRREAHLSLENFGLGFGTLQFSPIYWNSSLNSARVETSNMNIPNPNM